ncbi:hypothetical protein GE061_013527 [Apolygus lucorum]|uniref:Probable RNA-binding protein EIF1AD n=1 Tax=Apolygus lucorum TaxID=248454 RepID=A0A6A4JW03_APOLU|nr:hypothetical protein GE061_013527 [Apolygus lucorum]
MSKSTKRKHVVKELQTNDFSVPADNQQIVKLKEGRGNNLHSVESEDGSEFLVSMPSKFRRNVWVKRGDYLIIDVIPEGDKVRGEISAILDAEFTKFLKKSGSWPKAFEEPEISPSSSPRNNRRTFAEDTETSDSD